MIYGITIGVIKGIPGVWTIAHMGSSKKEGPVSVPLKLRCRNII